MNQINYKKEVSNILNKYSSNSKLDESFINEYIKNAYIGFLSKRDYQIKEIQYFCDISIMTSNFLNSIIDWLTLNTEYDLIFYRESTIHNQTFNRKLFPYENFVAKYSLNEDELFITLRDNRILYNENNVTIYDLFTNKDETTIVYNTNDNLIDFLNKLI